MLTGTRLIADVNECALKPGELALWWLGQHSFILKTSQAVLYLDPFLSPLPDRLVPPLLGPEEITNADFVLGSHDHLDHIDRECWPGLAKASGQARFVVPESLREGLSRDLRIPVQRFVGLDDLASVDLGSIRLTGIAAAHELLDPDALGRFPCLGFVIEADGVTIYHSGDCCMYEGLVSRLKRWQFDAMLLPINGRDARRLSSGCIGNMTYQEAADLAGAVGTRMVIPAHYDMFAMNLGPVNDFLDYVAVKYPAIRPCVCDYGQCVRIG